MYRKISIVILLSFTLLCFGCEINGLNNNKNTTKLTISDIKQLIGVTYNDIEKIYGTPEQSTYYLNKNNLSKIKTNYISLRNFNYYSIIKAYYLTAVEDKYIILWYKNNKVIKAFFDENDITNQDDFFKEVNNIDFKINYFKNSSYLKNYNSKKYKTYINSNIKTFNKIHNLNCPHIAVSLLKDNKTLYFYNINNLNNNTNEDCKCLFISTHNNKIIDVNIIKLTSICETIINYTYL